MVSVCSISISHLKLILIIHIAIALAVRRPSCLGSCQRFFLDSSIGRCSASCLGSCLAVTPCSRQRRSEQHIQSCFHYIWLSEFFFFLNQPMMKLWRRIALYRYTVVCIRESSSLFYVVNCKSNPTFNHVLKYLEAFCF